MNTVTFPGLNLSFEFSQIAFTIFGIAIYKYAICIAVGIVIALILCKLNKEKFGVDYGFILENTAIGVFAGTIGARLYFVLFNLDYYMNNLGEIFNFRNGGLAIYGGLIFGAIAIIINCKVQKKDCLDFFDCIIPYVAIAQCIGRFGNFFNIEAYGYETTSVLRMGINTVQGYIEVHPTFLYESIANLIIATILIILQRKRKYKGQILLVYFALYGLVRSVIEGIRTDSLMFFDIRISQILSIILLVIAVVLLFINGKRYKMALSKDGNTQK